MRSTQPRTSPDTPTASVIHRATASSPGTGAEWDRIATGYDTFVTASHMALAAEGLRRAGVAAGARLLDVAAGSGALSIPAARLGAAVLATDQSAAMLDRLAQRARREGLEVATRVMDGEHLDLEDDGFDIAGSQFGVMLFPDMPRGLREMVRVVRPGGRVLVHAYGDPRAVEFIGFFVAAAREVRPGFQGLPTDPAPLPFQLQDPARLRRELEGAGLRDIAIETVTETLRFPSGEGLWSWLISSNPIVESVLAELRLTDDERLAIRRHLDTMVRGRARGGIAELSNPVHIGIATKPHR